MPPFHLHIQITAEYLREIAKRFAKANPQKPSPLVGLLFGVAGIVGAVMLFVPNETVRLLGWGILIGFGTTIAVTIVGTKLFSRSNAEIVAEQYNGPLDVTISDEGIYTVTNTSRALRMWTNVLRAARFPDGTSMLYRDGASLWLPDAKIAAPHNGEGLFNYIEFNVKKVSEQERPLEAIVDAP